MYRVDILEMCSKFSIMLEHNVSKGPDFFVTKANSNDGIWLQRYDTDKKIKTEFMLIICSFAPSNVNFQTIWMPEVILAKFLSQKAGPLEPFLPYVCSK